MENWREGNVEEKSLHYKRESNIQYADQDCLNMVLHEIDGWESLHPKYNTTNNWAQE
jgi:lipopolysaccharide biosynthesis glycosyltransferase